MREGKKRGRGKGKKNKTRVTKKRRRCQLRILIAAKQPSAKLQSAKSTEDENSEGKTSDSELHANAQVLFRFLFAHFPEKVPLLLLPPPARPLSSPLMLLFVFAVNLLTKRLVAECQRY